MSKKQILVISPTPSHPRNAGNRERIYQLLPHIQKLDHEVHFLYITQEHRVTGFLGPPGNVEAIAQSIQKLLTDEHFRQQLGYHRRHSQRNDSTQNEWLTNIWNGINRFSKHSQKAVYN